MPHRLAAVLPTTTEQTAVLVCVRGQQEENWVVLLVGAADGLIG